MREGFTQRRCPKCGGNIYLTKDYYDGWYEKCLQCSRTWPLDDIVEVDNKVKATALKNRSDWQRQVGPSNKKEDW